MKILFIGGTGRLSKDTAKLALEKGHEVYLLTRGNKNKSIFVDSGYKMIYGDITNTSLCKGLLETMYFDVVVDYLSYNVDDLQGKLDVLNGKFKQYIFISSATIYNKSSEEEIIQEGVTSEDNLLWTYAHNKYLCEQYLDKYFKNNPDMFFTAVRPYITYGNTRIPYPIVPLDPSKEWTFIYRVLNNMPIPRFDQGDTITTLTHTVDFAKGIVGLFMNTKAINEKIHISNDSTTTWNNVLLCIEKKLSRKINIIEMSQEKIYTELPYYKEILIGDKGTNMRFDNLKIKTIVPEYENTISLSSGIDDMIDFYNENINLQVVDHNWNGQIDRLCSKNGHKVPLLYKVESAHGFISYYMGRFRIVGFLISKMTSIKNKVVNFR